MIKLNQKMHLQQYSVPPKNTFLKIKGIDKKYSIVYAFVKIKKLQKKILRKIHLHSNKVKFKKKYKC